MQYMDVQNVYKLKDWIQESNLLVEAITMNPCESAAKVFENLDRNFNHGKYDDPENLDLKKKLILQHPYKNICYNPSEWAREFILLNPRFWSFYNFSSNCAEWVEDMFEGRPDLIDWNAIAANPSKWACEKINRRVEKRNPKVFLDLYNLFINPSDWAGELIRKYSMTPVWYLLSENPAKWAGEIFKNNHDKIVYYHLSRNPAEWARKILEKNPNRIEYKMLCINPAEWAKEMLEKHPEKIEYDWLSRNQSDWAVDMMEKIVEKQPWKIHWFHLSFNRYIFTYDYAFLRERMRHTFAEELIQNRFHPRNFHKFASWGFEIFDFDSEDLCE